MANACKVDSRVSEVTTLFDLFPRVGHPMAPPIRLPGGEHQSRSWTHPVRRSWSRLKQVRGIRDLARWSLRSFRLAQLPLRIRPALVLGTFLALLLLSLLGFHPTLASHLAPSAVPWSDKVLHFICFGIATALFYSCWVVEEHARRVTFWRYWNELVSLLGFTLVGGIGSEFVQALLPYKSFQIGDVVANLLGSGLAVVVMHHYSRQARRAAELRTLYVHLDQINPEDDDDDDDDYDDAERGDSLDDERDLDQTRRRGNGEAAPDAEAGLLRHQRRRREMQESGRGGANMRFARVDSINPDSVAKRKQQQQALDPWSATDDEIFGLGDEDGDDDDDDDDGLMTTPRPPPSLTVTPPPRPPPPPGGRNPSTDAAAGPL